MMNLIADRRSATSVAMYLFPVTPLVVTLQPEPGQVHPSFVLRLPVGCTTFER